LVIFLKISFVEEKSKSLIWSNFTGNFLVWLTVFVYDSRNLCLAGHQSLNPVILATQEAEIRSITVQSQPKQKAHKILPQKNPSQKRAGGVAQGVGPEFKPQNHKK
jgi:hypothetical protein